MKLNLPSFGFPVPEAAVAMAAAVAMTLSSVAVGAELAFEQTLQGVKFNASSANNSSINTVRIVASAGDTELLSEAVDVEGVVSAVELADLDANGFPEIYIYANSAGSGSYGSLTAWASNRNLSMTPIYLPPLEQDDALTSGYMGHDEFTVGEGALLRRFPIYLEGDTNAAPSGGMRQVQYRLEPGEAGWILKAYNVSEY